jgi:putative copper export protein
MERALLILVHVLAATVWVGGHLVLAIAILPRALRARDPSAIERFEAVYEPLGLGALAIQIATGLRLAMIYAPSSGWFGFGEHVPRHLTLKLLLLVATVVVALHARVRLVPRLRGAGDPRAMRALGAHIALVTALAIAFVVVGVSFRTGLL